MSNNKKDVEAIVSVIEDKQKAIIQKQPMPDPVWRKLYARHNGRLTEICSVANETALSEIRNEWRQRNRGSGMNTAAIVCSDGGEISYNAGNVKRVVKSWGDLVEFAACRGIDMTGLTLSPEQKQYLYEFELQDKNLGKAKLSFAELDNMDLSGTKFSEAVLDHASLKNTAGLGVSFYKTKGYCLDLSGSHYSNPDVRYMKAPRSTHFKCVYDLPNFNETDWNSGHMVGSKLFVDKFSSWLDMSGGFAAACLFYGMGTSTVEAKIRFSQAVFSGSGFYNLKLAASESRGRKGDFSPLLLQDPRLTEEEKAFVSAFGQWLNSDHGMDGVKVSPELSLATDGRRIYSLFSETEIVAGSGASKSFFFSKGKVLSRDSFHECDLVDMIEIVPDVLKEKLQDTRAAVIEDKTPSAKSEEAEARITYDADRISVQIDALKRASFNEAMQLGSDLQKVLAVKSKELAAWAMDNVGSRTSFNQALDAFLTQLLDCKLEREYIEPPPPPPEPPVNKEEPENTSWTKSFFGSSRSKSEPSVEEALTKALTEMPAPVAEPDGFPELEEAMVSLLDAIESALIDNNQCLQNVQQYRKDLQALDEAFGAYIDGIETILPELEKNARDIHGLAKARQSSLRKSRDVVQLLSDHVYNLMAMVAGGGLTMQTFQGKIIPDIHAHFTRATGLHKLARACDNDPEAYKKDSQLEALYKTIVDDSMYVRTGPENIRDSFEKARQDIACLLQETSEQLAAFREKQREPLQAILNPASR